MKPETLLDAMTYIDEDLLARAEKPEGNPIRRFPRKLISLAACLALLLGATAFAAGILDPLLAYFHDPSGLYLEDFIAAGDSVSSDTLEIRAEGAIADSRMACLVVSLIGLDEAAARDLRRGLLDGRSDLLFTVMTREGEEVPFSTSTMGTYTAGRGQAISHFEDADATYVFSGTLPQSLSMEEVDQVCLTYGDLSLALPIGTYRCPEYPLEPEGEGLPEVDCLRMSAIGFSYRSTAEEPFPDLLPIRADGTVYETFHEDYGISSGGEWSSGPCTVTGHWCGGSPLALAVLDLEDYCGLQVDGVNYYFVTE